MDDEEELHEKCEELRLKFLESFPNPETLQARKSDLNQLFEEQTKTSDAALFLYGSNEEVHNWIVRSQQRMQKQGLKEGTKRRRRKTVGLFLHFLHHEGVRPKVSEALSRLASTSASSRKLPRRKESTEMVDRNGPLEDGVVQALLAAPDQETLRGKRDWPMLHLCVNYAVSREQLLTLNVGDFDRDQSLLRVPRLRYDHSLSLRLERLKHASAQEAPQDTVATVGDSTADQEHIFQSLPLLLETGAALCKYLEAAGHQEQEQAPLFCSLDHKRTTSGALGQRLTKNGIYAIVSFYAKRIGHPEINSRRLQQTGLARLASRRTTSHRVSSPRTTA